MIAFRCDDLRRALNGSRDYDLALRIGIGPVLGDHAQTIGALRA